MASLESWYEAAIEKFRPYFQERGITLPKNIHCHLGFPSNGLRSSVVGETYPRYVSKDRQSHIFISPKLNNPIEVLSVLCHELVHVSFDCDHAHKRPFRERAASLGMVAPFTEAQADRELRSLFQEWMKDLGTYPHAGFRQKSSAYGEPKKTYLRRVMCDCGYVMRITKTWLDKAVPDCPVCKIPMSVK